MRYGTKSIALTLFALIAACASDPPRPGPGSGSDAGVGSNSDPGTGTTPKPADVPEALCKRFDTCNVLEDSVDNCIQKLNREISIFTPNERADIERALQGCFVLQSCDIFMACVAPTLLAIEGTGSTLDGSQAPQ